MSVDQEPGIGRHAEPFPPGPPSLRRLGTLPLLLGWPGCALKTWPQHMFEGQLSEQGMDVEKTCT